MSAFTPEQVATICVAMFRDMTGLKDSPRGHAASDAQILNDKIETFDVDSLSVMEYVMAIEERFDIVLDEKAVNRCRNVAGLVELAAAKLNV